MAPDTIALLAGVVFLLIAVVGGGFSVERLQIPTVPRWSRVVAGVVGVAFIAGFLVSSLQDPRAPTPGSSTSLQSPAAASSGPAGDETVELFRFAGPERSPDGVELRDFVLTAGRSEPMVGDVITARFTLRNGTRQPIRLSTFVAARSPRGDHEDTGESAARRLSPGEDLPTMASLTVDSTGSWSFWPCYGLGSGECPDEWQLHQVTVAR